MHLKGCMALLRLQVDMLSYKSLKPIPRPRLSALQMHAWMLYYQLCSACTWHICVHQNEHNRCQMKLCRKSDIFQQIWMISFRQIKSIADKHALNRLITEIP